MKKNFLLTYSLWKYPHTTNVLKHIIRIMKMTMILVLVFVFQLGATPTHSQNTKVNITESSLSLKEFMVKIENQTDYLFLYSEKELDLNQSVNHVKARNKEVRQVLTEAFSNSDIQFSLNENYISLRKKETTGTRLFPQQSGRRISGTVVDDRGEPVIGANIMERGTTNGTTTDIDGNFTLVVGENAQLQVSYIGYLSVTIPVDNQTTVAIHLKEDTQNLEEIVVVGYGTQKKVNLTGSVSSISAADLINKPVTNTSTALAGLAPGLSVLQTSGRPGAGASVRIRGTGTFSSAGTSPLVLIDGLSGNIDDVDPNDIQSISFLKDAASASIYGNRAAN